MADKTKSPEYLKYLSLLTRNREALAFVRTDDGKLRTFGIDALLVGVKFNAIPTLTDEGPVADISIFAVDILEAAGHQVAIEKATMPA